MKSTFGMVAASLLVMAASAQTIELKPTPIQTEFLASLSVVDGESDTWSDPADDEQKSSPQTEWGERRSGKSMAKAIALSALIPGAGEYYVGNKSKAKYFFAADVLTWLGFFAYRTYGNWKQDDMIKFASDRSGASLEGKSEEFEDWVGFYDDIDDFNQAGRETDPDRDFLVDTPANHWRWASSTDRETYVDIKGDYRMYHRNANFMLGVALINRIISVVDAVRDVRRHRSTMSGSMTSFGGSRVRLSIEPFSSDGQVKLALHPGF
jgi:hypothetical protein